jgi:ADP-ribose pyrophosphatase YjhB (NUDIX family)
MSSLVRAIHHFPANAVNQIKSHKISLFNIQENWQDRRLQILSGVAMTGAGAAALLATPLFSLAVATSAIGSTALAHGLFQKTLFEPTDAFRGRVREVDQLLSKIKTEKRVQTILETLHIKSPPKVDLPKFQGDHTNCTINNKGPTADYNRASVTHKSWKTVDTTYAPNEYTAPGIVARIEIQPVFKTNPGTNEILLDSNRKPIKEKDICVDAPWSEPLWGDESFLEKAVGKARYSLDMLKTYWNNRVFTSLQVNTVERDPVSGRPLNPVGRTGVIGRGNLGRWGTNFAADPFVKRIDPETGRLQILLIKRPDGSWALPGGMVDKGESFSAAARRELGEEADATVNLTEEIYKGYVDDTRNTDNAWMETSVIGAHLRANEVSAQRQLTPQPGETLDAQWVDVTAELTQPGKLFASHSLFVKLGIKAMDQRVVNLCENKAELNTIRAMA